MTFFPFSRYYFDICVKSGEKVRGKIKGQKVIVQNFGVVCTRVIITVHFFQKSSKIFFILLVIAVQCFTKIGKSATIFRIAPDKHSFEKIFGKLSGMESLNKQTHQECKHAYQ